MMIRHIVYAVAFSLVAGCAAGHLRSTMEMESGNPISSIALIGYANIKTKYQNDDDVLSINLSKKAGEFMLQKTQAELKQKGYTVDYAKSFGVGLNSYSPNGKNVAYEESPDGKFGFKRMVITDGKPVYLYPEFDNTEPKSIAVAKAADEHARAGGEFGYASLKPDPSVMLALKESTQADTICLLGLSGHKLSDLDKFHDASMAKILRKPAPATSTGSDFIRASLTCFNTSLQKIVWQDNAQTKYVNDTPNLFFAGQLLRNFPNKGAPLDASCKRPDPNKPMYSCGK